VDSLASGTQRGEEVDMADGSTKLLAGQKALVTGANSGIGEAAASALGEKGGVVMMMKTLAQEVTPRHIRVNGVAPGAVRTPINMAAWMTLFPDPAEGG
jgi:NAD(P)-dependent dehydrogenase (short-subunit alcohol dehydrogenase family)